MLTLRVVKTHCWHHHSPYEKEVGRATAACDHFVNRKGGRRDHPHPCSKRGRWHSDGDRLLRRNVVGSLRVQRDRRHRRACANNVRRLDSGLDDCVPTGSLGLRRRDAVDDRLRVSGAPNRSGASRLPSRVGQRDDDCLAASYDVGFGDRSRDRSSDSRRNRINECVDRVHPVSISYRTARVWLGQGSRGKDV